MNVSSDSSNEDEPLATANSSESIDNSNIKSESEENRYVCLCITNF